MVDPEVPDTTFTLQDRDVEVEVEAVDALDLQGDVLVEYLGDAAC
jgi:hypothetical protein